MRSYLSLSLRAVSLFLLSLQGTVISNDWAQFRGGSSLSVSLARSSVNWNDPRTVWRTPIPGSGWSQPIVVGDKVFVTTASSPKAGRPKGMTAGVMDLSTMGKAAKPKDSYDFQLLCLSLTTGQILWEKTVANAIPTYGKHASNTFATETPAANSSAVYVCFGAAGVLAAFDHSGNPLWQKSLETQKIQNDFGTGSSLLLLDDRLFVQLYNEDFAKLLCVSIRDGKDMWMTSRSTGTSWSTPIAWNNQGTLEIVTGGKGSVIAYDATSGSERWKFGGLDTSFSCSIVADKTGVYFGTSSPGSQAPIAAIAPGNTGDLSLAKGTKESDAVMWSGRKSGAGMPSPVIVEDNLYFFGNTATCYDKRTGKELFRERLPGGTLAAGSPIVDGDRIVLVNEAGNCIVITHGSSFQIEKQFDIGSREEVFWSTPALVPSGLLVRSSDALYCIR